MSHQNWWGWVSFLPFAKVLYLLIAKGNLDTGFRKKIHPALYTVQ